MVLKLCNDSTNDFLEFRNTDFQEVLKVLQPLKEFPENSMPEDAQTQSCLSPSPRYAQRQICTNVAVNTCFSC